MAYKEPTFQDRMGSAAQARKKALEQLRAKPAPTAEELAERAAAQKAKDDAAQERREARRAADAAAAAEKEEKRAAEQAALEEAERLRVEAEAELAKSKKPVKVVLSDEEKKAARDARYAARRARSR